MVKQITKQITFDSVVYTSRYLNYNVKSSNTMFIKYISNNTTKGLKLYCHIMQDNSTILGHAYHVYVPSK